MRAMIAATICKQSVQLKTLILGTSTCLFMLTRPHINGQHTHTLTLTTKRVVALQIVSSINTLVASLAVGERTT